MTNLLLCVSIILNLIFFRATIIHSRTLKSIRKIANMQINILSLKGTIGYNEFVEVMDSLNKISDKTKEHKND